MPNMMISLSERADQLRKSMKSYKVSLKSTFQETINSKIVLNQMFYQEFSTWNKKLNSFILIKS